MSTQMKGLKGKTSEELVCILTPNIKKECIFYFFDPPHQLHHKTQLSRCDFFLRAKSSTELLSQLKLCSHYVLACVLTYQITSTKTAVLIFLY